MRKVLFAHEFFTVKTSEIIERRGKIANISIDAKASTTEEPDAGKPHVRVWAGGAG